MKTVTPPTINAIYDYLKSCGSPKSPTMIMEALAPEALNDYASKQQVRSKICTRCIKLFHQGYLTKIGPGVWVCNSSQEEH